MAEVLVHHHVQGLTDGIRAFADELRGSGHTVHTPDLYDGATFATLDEGLAHARELGFAALRERGTAVADDLPAELVHVGFSLGVVTAQQLAQTRPGARGAVLAHACLPATEFGQGWPADVPVQVHGMDADPFFAEEGDLDAARALVASVPHAELFLYPGDQHLFTDASLASHDPEATRLFVERVLDLLDRVS